jgi:hypothetical protein
MIVLAGCLWATGLLAETPAPPASFTFSEKLVETVDSFGTGEVNSYSGSLSVTGSLAGVDIATFNESTPFTVAVGDFVLAATLGDDLNYVAGKKTAAFSTYDRSFLPPLVLNRVTVSWTATNFTVSGTLFDFMDQTNTIVVLNHDGTRGSFARVSQGFVQLGSATGSRSVTYSGTTTYATGTTPAGELATVVTVQASGQSDNVRPTVTITSPTNNARVTVPFVTVTGRATDNVGVSKVLVSVNNGDFLAVAGTTNWTAQFSLLVGTNLIQAQSMDLDGNSSTTATLKVFYALTAPLQVQLVGQGSLKSNYNGQWLDVGRGYNMTATGSNGHKFSQWIVSTNWEGSLVVATQTLNFTMQSNLTLTAVFVDTNKPTVQVTNLAANQRISNALFTVKGTAKDNVGASNVWYRLNGGAWAVGAGAATWSAPLALAQRSNSFQVYAADAAGNHSTTSSVAFLNVMTGPLLVSSVGAGTLTPNYSNKVLEIGLNYSLKAAGANGHKFSQWIVSTNWTGGWVVATQTLNFMMQSNLTLTAVFVDTNKPTVLVTNLAANQRISNAVFTVKGTAKDNVGVSNVWFQLNSGVWTVASGGSVWSAPVTLRPSTNVFSVYAQDTAGNRSATNTVRFTCTVSNRPPVAATNSLNTAQNKAVALTVAEVLGRCGDPDGDPVSLASVTASTNGAPVMLAGGQITYSPLTNFVGADRFNYLVSDGRGGTATGEVRVDVYPGTVAALHIVSAEKSAQGLLLRIAGIPGRSYQVERAPALNSPWNTLTNLTAGPSGIMDCTDANGLPGGAFYRAKATP